ncbi:glycosyltransferase family 2 protein [Actinocrispum wychmicini]|uniref:Cellulose synthase (UDP-forming) n=1 Tax=Actinocrispum wychmicini TaxID=1213861 RepID=A0A4R2ILC2_9PSEU|nr:cellulose synthase catalytic subunit [Actinocrispum wychmicini]TCO45282.1 cellulose synthase (UDP-forming) [Actinocrispum wychmicini]
MSASAVIEPHADHDLHLPAPPDDGELYGYFGPQRRWVLTCISLSFVFVAVTLFLFSLRHPALWVFIGVLAINVAGWLLSCVDGQKQRRLTRHAHELLVRSWRPERYPSVDVFLPTCGEDLAILRNTYRHVFRLSWPAELRVWVLDDAARPEVAELAEAFGFEYRSRPDRGHLKKAGNLNFGLDVSHGDVIAVFDADFCPRPDFLTHLLPYLEDPDIGIVQSPQCFDTHTAMGWLERAAGAAQELFYRWLQPSRDASDAAICCGTNAVYRRAALVEIDGFPKMSHSEDMFTSIELLRRGKRTQYVPVQLAKGMSPATLSSFVNQQYRWCMGNLELLFDRDFHRMRLPVRTRLSFWNGFVSYFANAVNIFAVPLPGLVMAFGYPQDVRAWHMVPFLIPVWIWLVLLPAVSRTRWRMEVVRAQTLYSFCHAVAIVHVLRRRTATWVPTGVSGAGRSPLARTVSRLIIGWLVPSTVAAWVGVLLGAADYGWREYWPMAAFAAATTYLAAPLVVAAWHTLTGETTK